MDDLRNTLYYVSICLFRIQESYLLILLFQGILSKLLRFCVFVGFCKPCH